MTRSDSDSLCRTALLCAAPTKTLNTLTSSKRSAWTVKNTKSSTSTPTIALIWHAQTSQIVSLPRTEAVITTAKMYLTKSSSMENATRPVMMCLFQSACLIRCTSAAFVLHVRTGSKPTRNRTCVKINASKTNTGTLLIDLRICMQWLAGYWQWREDMCWQMSIHIPLGRSLIKMRNVLFSVVKHGELKGLSWQVSGWLALWYNRSNLCKLLFFVVECI